MLREDVVREMLARLARGKHVKAIARELGVHKKTIKRWRGEAVAAAGFTGVPRSDRRVPAVSRVVRS